MVSGSRIAADRKSGPLGTVKSICLYSKGACVAVCVAVRVAVRVAGCWVL